MKLLSIFIKFTRRKTLIFFKDMLLKELLKTRGVKQNWLASRLGVSEVTVSNWVKEKSVPSQKHLEKLSEILNIPIKELIN
jgi:transcriptional regulator with XRE-family HTH domain